MKLVLLGPPGAGKGTQAQRLARDLGVPHISTGEILRQAVSSGTPLGSEVKRYLDAGYLVPDETIVRIVAEKLKQKDSSEGYILDGFPRTLGQAKALEEEMNRSGEHLDAVIYLEVPDEVAIGRLSKRRVCPNCGANFHIETLPSRLGDRCDRCKTLLVRRKDDAPETVAQRLRLYASKTAPLLKYYEDSGLLKKVRADESIEKVYTRVKKAVGL